VYQFTTELPVASSPIKKNHTPCTLHTFVHVYNKINIFNVVFQLGVIWIYLYTFTHNTGCSVKYKGKKKKRFSLKTKSQAQGNKSKA